jgi:hypothetical protein
MHATEEDSGWAKEILAKADDLKLDNIEMISGTSGKIFSEKWEVGNWYVVAIDGSRERLNIFHRSLGSDMRRRGIIYDDTDKVENRSAVQESIPEYKRFIYLGFKPQTVHVYETTVFHRE